MISVKSADRVWALAVGDIARAHRGEWAFHYGSRVRFHAELPDGGRMGGFVAFAPLACTQEEATVQLAEYRVAAVGMIPIYPGEPAAIDANGSEWFFGRPRRST
jgi:hypothetical protein